MRSRERNARVVRRIYSFGGHLVGEGVRMEGLILGFVFLLVLVRAELYNDVGSFGGGPYERVH
jgi:hypothetical protein